MTEEFIASAQSNLETARRQIKEAVVDLDIPDEAILALRKNARRAQEELNRLQRQAAKKRLLSFLKLW